MKARITFDIELPPEASRCTEKQIEDWLRFHFRDNGVLEGSPLSELEPEPIFGTFHWQRLK